MSKKKINITIENLPVMVIRQGEYFVCYSPALDFSSYGESFDEAKKLFAEAVEIFFEETHERNTLVSELERLGWQVNEATSQYLPPVMVESAVQPMNISLNA